MTLTRSGGEIALYFAEAMADLLAGEAVKGEGGGPRDPLRAPDGRPVRPRYNVTPGQDVLTLVPAPSGSGAGESVEFAWKRWGLVPSWAKDPAIGHRLFNARSETAAEKPSFRAAWKRRRCIVAADGFYEWTPRNRDHRPFHFSPRHGTLLAFAGLFEAWRGEGGEVIDSCTVLTTAASADLEGIHHRMPVILAPEDLAAWLDPATPPDSLVSLAVSAPADTLLRKAVSRYVNDPRHDDMKCLEPESASGEAVPRKQSDQGELFALESVATKPSLADEEF